MARTPRRRSLASLGMKSRAQDDGSPRRQSHHKERPMTDRIFNFSAGPAALPEPVLRKAQEAIWNVAGSGIGIMEHSHRGKVFDRIINEAEQNCRALAGITDNYRVLFLQGGASLQFAMIPLYCRAGEKTAEYLVTGVWSQKAVKEAKPLG